MTLIELTNENFNEKVSSKKPIIIDFFADWCMPCQMMGPVFKELSQEIKGLDFAKLDTEKFPDIAGIFNITGIPCLIIVKNKKEIARIVGFNPKDTLKTKIQGILDSI